MRQNKISLIAHRGNVAGKKPDIENTPSYLDAALARGYDVEVDVWYIKDKYYLGHDAPKTETTFEYLNNDRFWCHCKNIEALYELINTSVHCFFHQNDDVTLTSKGLLWVFPGKVLVPGSICVMPELGYDGDISRCAGICSDLISEYKK